MKKILFFVMFAVALLPLSCSKDIQNENEVEEEVKNEVKVEAELSDETINMLKDYIQKETELNSEIVNEMLSGFIRNPDIGLEFEKRIINQEYETENPIRIEGYTAKDIAELAPFMEVLGVYNFMVSLREYPEYALMSIKAGFPHDEVVPVESSED